MAEEVNKIDAALSRIKDLNTARENVESKRIEIESHNKDLTAIETIKGVSSQEYIDKKERIAYVENELKEAEAKVEELSFKKSELKPVLDELAKKFEDELRTEQEKEYHIEIGTKDEKGSNNGKRVFKQLLDYLYHDVKFTSKTAGGLMVLVRNMEENKPWVNSKDFDGVIILRSSNILVLWRSMIEDLEGKGFYEARTFLETWANCGKSLSDAIREVQKQHESTRILGTQLNTVEDEFDKSEDDLPHDEQSVSTQEEVDPEVD